MVVNAAELATVEPIGPGIAKVAPPSKLAFRFGIFVVDAMTKGAVPVETVEVMTLEADIVVNAPELAVVDPIGPGIANVFPFNKLAFKLATLVVEVITNGAPLL